MTVDVKTTEKALRLRALGEGVLVLPNAWDAGSAAVIEAAGASAIATTSGGVAWGIGRGDGQHAEREEMLAAAARIVAAVDLPVTVDVEGGYGDVAATVRGVVAMGGVGINLEDSKAAGGPLHTVEEQCERIRAARAAAAGAGLPELVVNARTDVFLFGIGEESGRLGEVLARIEAYAAMRRRRDLRTGPAGPGGPGRDRPGPAAGQRHGGAGRSLHRRADQGRGAPGQRGHRRRAGGVRGGPQRHAGTAGRGHVRLARWAAGLRDAQRALREVVPSR